MASLLDRLARIAPRSGPLKNPTVQRVLLGVVVVLLASVAFVVRTPPVGLTEGAPAPRTFRANQAVQFEDEAATQAAQQEAADSVEPVFVFDAAAGTAARGDVTIFFDTVLAAQAANSGDVTATVAAISDEMDDIDPDTIATAAAMSEQDLRDAKRSGEQLITTVMNRRFVADELGTVTEQMIQSVSTLPVTSESRAILSTVLSDALRATLILDPDATAAAQEAAAEGVDPIVIVRQPGENIVQRGEIVTAEHIEIIARTGMLEQVGSLPSRAAIVVLTALMVGVVGAYLMRYDPAVWSSLKSLTIISVLFVGMVWLTRGVTWLWPEVPLYLLPIPLAAMLATLLLGAREGLLVALLTALAGVLLGFSTGSAVVGMAVWALAGVVAMDFMNDRRSLFYVGAFLVTSGALVGLMASLTAGLAFQGAALFAMWGALGGLITAVLGYGLLPFFEYVFGVTTDVRLLELGNPAHPLLRELMVKAPGTYTHSLMTGNLAEAGAEAIGANALLARVGSYYHDIGKLRRPGFFIENQAGQDNPHDTTSPTLSALIITSHVREGLELAAQYRLPREITDIIRQHHGTSLVTYFYNKAAEGDGPVYEADFRYGGEKPTSREAALVMFADSTEAAVRTVKKPTPPRIEAAVRKVVDAKVADGQLDRADLTLADIETTILVYSKLLSASYHSRVEYPEPQKGRDGDVRSYREPSRP
jgi:putative nucleotidyltransferase with HDIG domain